MPFVASAVDRLAAPRAVWSSNVRFRRLVIFGPVVVAVFAILLYLIAPTAYFWFIAEYSVVEDLQFVFYLSGSVVSLLLGLHLWRHGGRRLAALYFLGALGLFFIAGEEVSWGQELFERIFTWWPTKNELRSINVQGETTLHNLQGVGQTTRWALFLVAIYGVLSPLLRRLAGRLAGSRGASRWTPFVTFARATLPSFVLAGLFFAVALLGYSGSIAPPYTQLEHAFLRYQEVAELAISFGIFLHVWLLLTERPTSPAGIGEPTSGSRPLPANSSGTHA